MLSRLRFTTSFSVGVRFEWKFCTSEVNSTSLCTQNVLFILSTKSIVSGYSNGLKFTRLSNIPIVFSFFFYAKIQQKNKIERIIWERKNHQSFHFTTSVINISQSSKISDELIIFAPTPRSELHIKFIFRSSCIVSLKNNHSLSFHYQHLCTPFHLFSLYFLPYFSCTHLTPHFGFA